MKHPILAILALGLLSACQATTPVKTSAPEFGVHEYELGNGLRLLVKPDRRAPVVVSQIWYKVGSNYEHGGITGVSHVLEHMMFQGTENTAPGEFSRTISRLGGRENAFTGKDYTAYFQQLEKSHLATALRLEADRMRNLRMQEEDFRKELQVVMEERRLRTDDKPEALTYERFMATAFLASPVRQPIIGWMDDLEHMRMADLREWYDAWYAPNNAILVVVGDVDPEAVLALAQETFGRAASRPLGQLKPRQEPPQSGTRRVVVRAPAKVPSLILGYKVPNLAEVEAEWEVYALEMAAGVLDGGASARLARNLVRGEAVAASAGAGFDPFARLPGLFTLSGTPAQGRSLAELEEALLAEVRRLQESLVAQAELERVKAQVTAAKVYERDSVFYQAMQLGMLETVGWGWRRLESYADRIAAVTPEQIQAVARKYLQADQLTVAILEPQTEEEVARDR